MPSPCQPYVVKAVDYLCTLTAHLDAATLRALLAIPAVCQAEAAVDMAALAGDVAATKAACRAWWGAWKMAMVAQLEARQLLARGEDGFDR